MNLKEVLTKDGFLQLANGHPWLKKFHFKKSFKFPTHPCVYPLGEHWFFVSPHSTIPFRRLGPLQAYWPDFSEVRDVISSLEEFEKKFFHVLVDHCAHRYEIKKKLVGDDSSFRWLFSENDENISEVIKY